MLVRRSRRRPRRSGVLVVALLLALAGCTSDDEPTVSQAGETLKNHVLQLLKERNAQDIEITDPGGTDIACDGGKARRTFAATGRDLANRADAEALNTMLVGSLNAVAPYEVVSADAQGQPIRVVSKATRTILVFESPGDGLYVVRGETECLPTT